MDSSIILFLKEIFEDMFGTVYYFGFLLVVLLYSTMIMFYNIKTKNTNSKKNFTYYFKTENIIIDTVSSYLLFMLFLYMLFSVMIIYKKIQ